MICVVLKLPYVLNSLKLECEKLASEKTEMQRHYVMVRKLCHRFIVPISLGYQKQENVQIAGGYRIDHGHSASAVEVVRMWPLATCNSMMLLLASDNRLWFDFSKSSSAWGIIFCALFLQIEKKNTQNLIEVLFRVTSKNVFVSGFLCFIALALNSFNHFFLETYNFNVFYFCKEGYYYTIILMANKRHQTPFQNFLHSLCY